MCISESKTSANDIQKRKPRWRCLWTGRFGTGARPRRTRCAAFARVRSRDLAPSRAYKQRLRGAPTRSTQPLPHESFPFSLIDLRSTEYSGYVVVVSPDPTKSLFRSPARPRRRARSCRPNQHAHRATLYSHHLAASRRSRCAPTVCVRHGTRASFTKGGHLAHTPYHLGQQHERCTHAWRWMCCKQAGFKGWNRHRSIAMAVIRRPARRARAPARVSRGASAGP